IVPTRVPQGVGATAPRRAASASPCPRPRPHHRHRRASSRSVQLRTPPLTDVAPAEPTPPDAPAALGDLHQRACRHPDLQRHFPPRRPADLLQRRVRDAGPARPQRARLLLRPLAAAAVEEIPAPRARLLRPHHPRHLGPRALPPRQPLRRPARLQHQDAVSAAVGRRHQTRSHQHHQ
ncbi:hypothetical protein LTR16_010978, partial [Cryomyces antarcticus]